MEGVKLVYRGKGGGETEHGGGCKSPVNDLRLVSWSFSEMGERENTSAHVVYTSYDEHRTAGNCELLLTLYSSLTVRFHKVETICNVCGYWENENKVDQN